MSDASLRSRTGPSDPDPVSVLVGRVRRADPEVADAGTTSRRAAADRVADATQGANDGRHRAPRVRPDAAR
jgi:hypothetical protein